MSKLYPIGIQNFEKIRKEGYVYIDKTAMIYQLVRPEIITSSAVPRRLAKSLLISTLEAYFQGKKELFTGLAMEKLEKDWIAYPILHLDLNTENYSIPQSLELKLERALSAWEQLYGSDPAEKSLASRFEGIIQRAYEKTGQRVVILVDEYDKPMLQAIGNEALQTAYRNTLKGFYGALKSKDGCIRFGILTGVTKFSKVSVFSDLNNLDDISMWNEFIEICGISDRELEINFKDDLHELADANGMTYEAAREKVKQYYDGYHFTHNSIGMYNPFSLLHTFKRKEFGSYWFATGTPTYLVTLLQKHNYDLTHITHEETSVDVLDGIDSADTDPIPVIYQSGYLTIKGYDARFGTYRLGFPNREVEEGFVRFLLPFYANVSTSRSAFEIGKFVKEIEQGDYNSFFRRLQSFFADTPYETITGHTDNKERELELHYQNVLFIVFKLMGFYTKVEYHTNEGRIDLVLQTDQYIYIMEFKLNGTAEEALQQIKENIMPSRSKQILENYSG